MVIFGCSSSDSKSLAPYRCLTNSDCADSEQCTICGSDSIPPVCKVSLDPLQDPGFCMPLMQRCDSELDCLSLEKDECLEYRCMATAGVGSTCNPVQIPANQGGCEMLFEYGSEPWFHDPYYYVERYRALNEAGMEAGCEGTSDAVIEMNGLSEASLQTDCGVEVLRYWECAETLTASDFECDEQGWPVVSSGRCQEELSTLDECYLATLNPQGVSFAVCRRNCAQESTLTCTVANSDGTNGGGTLVLTEPDGVRCSARFESPGESRLNATLDCETGRYCWNDPESGASCETMLWDLEGFESTSLRCSP